MINTISKFAVVGMLAGALTAPSFGQAGNWKVDSDHSDARFSIDGTINKTNQTITLGAARVSGVVTLDKNDLTKSAFAFNLYPATSISQAIDQSEESLRGDRSDLTNSTHVSFKSEYASLTTDGKLRVIGNLSLTRVDSNVDLTPSEAYAGAENAHAVLHRVTRESSFVIAVPDLPSAGAEGGRNIELLATAVMNREDFAPLMAAVFGSNWPPVVQDEKCQTPATISEDYAGASCTGNVVQVSSLPAIYTGTGEDYPGPGAASAELGNNLSISVHIQLTGEQHQLSAKANN